MLAWLKRFESLLVLAERLDDDLVDRVWNAHGPGVTNAPQLRNEASSVALEAGGANYADGNSKAVVLAAAEGVIALSEGETNLGLLWQALKGLASALRKAAGAYVAGRRSDDDRAVAFYYIYYRLEERMPGAGWLVDRGDLAEELGCDHLIVNRLIEEAHHDYNLEWVGQGQKLTVSGRRMVKDLLTSDTPVAIGDPWSHHPSDDSHDKWSALLKHSAFLSDGVGAVDEATAEQPLSLIFLDIDNFKAINSALGEPTADANILEPLTHLIRTTVGRRGRAYCFGGEEFVVLLPHFTETEAAAVAERLRAAVEKRTWQGVSGVTLSIGVAQFPSRGIVDLDGLQKAAVVAEKVAKASGKNQVRVASELPSIAEPSVAGGG